MDHRRMRRKTFTGKVVWHSLVLLVSLTCLFVVDASPAFALNLDEYFTYTYNIELSKTEVHGDEPFSITVTGQATCKKNLPDLINEARIVGRIVAQHQSTGAAVILNPEYILEVKPFPAKEGDTAQDTVNVQLSFPAGSESGTYNIIGQLVEARVRILGLIWYDVTPQLPQTQPMGTVTYVADNGTGGSNEGGGGGGGGDGTADEEDDLSDYVDDDGRFIRDFSTESSNSKVKLSVPENTVGLTAQGEPLSEININQMDEPPLPPESHNVIGLAYEFGPEGATFNPPITISFTYDPSLIPPGVNEENLVIAVWDPSAGEWVELVCTVDPDTNTITAQISHFSILTVMASTRPAVLTVSELTITPDEVFLGQTITISALVTNTGDLEGTFEVSVQINNVVIETKEVTLHGGASETVTFSTSRDTVGTCTVVVDGLFSQFEVKKPVPATFTIKELSINPLQADSREKVTVSVRVTNTGELTDTCELALKIEDEIVDTKWVTLEGGESAIVPLTVSRDSPGIYTVSIGDEVGQFTVKKPAVPPTPKPAQFALSHLTITPAEVQTGEQVTISVVVANTGGLSGSYEITLRIDDKEVTTKQVTLDGGMSRDITFTITRNTAKTYAIRVNDLQGTLIVNSPQPLVNRSYWWLTGTIIASVIIIASAILVVIRRRRT